MSEADYPFLFKPFSAKRFALKNRVVMSPHGTGMVVDGKITDDDIAYFAARVRHVGMVITAATLANPTARLRIRNRVEAFDEAVVPVLAKRNQVIKQYGARVIGQMVNIGRERLGLESDFPPVGASAIRGVRDSDPPHELEADEVRTLAEDFARSSANLKAAGYDGMEVHAAHGYLVAQFLSPATNHRTDAYGGTPEKRRRFLIEIVEAVRQKCGDDFVIGVRMSADEETAEGLHVQDTAEISEALARHGVIDYLNITLGMRGGYVKDAAEPEAPAARAAGIIRQRSGLPVIVGQKITSPALGEKVLAEGLADMVGMARAFVADPDVLSKAIEGHSDRTRPCVGLNQDCRAFAPHLHCAVNPATGRERRPEFGPLRPAGQAKRIAVIGGGPAGMEAARIAAKRGHRVTLFEAEDRLGGQFLYAAALPRRGALGRILDHLAAELRHEGVEVRLGQPVSGPSDLAGFDEVIAATGAKAAALAEKHAAQGVKRWFDIVAEGAPAPHGSGHALFADDGSGFWTSYGIAEALIAAGWRVTFATPSGLIGKGIPEESAPSLVARLAKAGTRYRVLASLYQARPESAELLHASGETEAIACDLVVLQTGRIAVDGIGKTLRQAGMPIHSIGDCLAPRRIGHAMLDAQNLARAI